MANVGGAGMCSNPFGGNDRLDRIDFLDYASGTDNPFKLLYLKVISDAASDYLYFGLGRNGTVPDDFWYATEYFFTCRSYKRETWDHAKFMRNAYVDEDTGKRVSTTIMLRDEDLMAACFDRHYEIAELHNLMPIDVFLEWLRTRREEILEENKQQVNAYMDLLQRTSVNRVADGEQIPFKLLDRMQVLARPESPEQVAELVFYAPRYRQSTRRHSTMSKNKREMSTPPYRPPRYRSVVAPPGQLHFVLTP